jgi:hypothetical protein
MNSAYAAAAGNVTLNAYSGFNLVGSAAPLTGGLACLVFVLVLAFMPRIIYRLILGYIALVAVSIGFVVLYALVKSIGPITDWLWGDLFSGVGQFIIDYWLYVLLSLPCAYYAGGLVDRYFDKVVPVMDKVVEVE